LRLTIKVKLAATFVVVVALSAVSMTVALQNLGSLMGLPDYKYASGYQKIKDFNAEPGTRFPHSWIKQDGQTISTLDLLGKGFVLFTGPGFQKDNAGQKTTIPLTIHHMDEIRGAILVRPDGFVAWRTEKLCNWNEITAELNRCCHSAP